jgi:thiamine biosynthesis lipoprotein
VAVAETSWRALGTSVHVLVTDDGSTRAARDAVASMLELVDATYSRFRPDSELRRIAAVPGAPARVSPLLGRAIEAALRGARLSDGAVDPTVGTAMRLIGYDVDFEAIGRDAGGPTITVARVPGWQAVGFDPETRTLRLPPGVELDLGSTGKALAADLAAEAACAATGAGVLVNLGGDIATAGPVPDGGWRVLVADDARARPDGPGETIGLTSGAIATSSTTVRRWTRGGIALHHIVDPATGAPARGPWRTVSVVAGTCVDANTAATAAIVRGRTATGWLAALGLPARLVSHAGDVTRVAGWPPDMTLYAGEVRS